MTVTKKQTVDADGHYVDEFVAVKEDKPQAAGTTYWRNGKKVESVSPAQIRNGQIVSAEAARHGVVGSLEEREGLTPSGMETPIEVAQQLQAEMQEFAARYPQVIVDGEDGVQNGSKLSEWLKARGASFTAKNFSACLNDIPGQFIFNPSAIGLQYGSRMTGAEAVRKLNSTDFDKLLKPQVARERSRHDMNSVDYKAAELAKDPKSFTVNQAAQDAVEINSMKDAINNFMAMRPAYVASDLNRSAILSYLVEHKLPVSFNGLIEAFDSLVRSGEMKINTEAHSSDGSGQKANYALAAGAHARGVVRSNSERFNKLLDSLSAEDYWKKYRTTASFRAAVDQLG